MMYFYPLVDLSMEWIQMGEHALPPQKSIRAYPGASMKYWTISAWSKLAKIPKLNNSYYQFAPGNEVYCSETVAKYNILNLFSKFVT